MYLSESDERVLAGDEGNAAAKSMRILVALGEIYGADSLIPVDSVQIAGVSYHNLGEAGLEYLAELAEDGQVKVPTTLNPAGMDLIDWRAHGIPEDFAKKQVKVVEAFKKMGVNPTCTCTPYFVGVNPTFGSHVAWSESSAVTYVNSVLGARTNKEGGPSALASAICGKTPNYGLHLDEKRQPDLTFKVEAKVETLTDWGALGYAVGVLCENKIPYIKGAKTNDTDFLKSFGASLVTYGSKPLYHLEGITPEADKVFKPKEEIIIGQKNLDAAYEKLNDNVLDIDFVSLGCPHASLEEIRKTADYLGGKKVSDDVVLWITTSRGVKEEAKKEGYVEKIEQAGGFVVADTCMVVAPLKGRFKNIATTSAKACFYCRGKNHMNVRIGSFKQCLDAAVSGRWQ